MGKTHSRSREHFTVGAGAQASTKEVHEGWDEAAGQSLEQEAHRVEESNHVEVERLETGEKVINSYIKRETISKGKHGGKVALYSKGDNLYAVKSAPRPGKWRQRVSAHTKDPGISIIREKKALMLLNHPGIVRLFEAIDDPSHDTIYLVLEHLTGGSIYHPQSSLDSPPSSPIPLHSLRSMLGQVLEAVAYMHGQGVVHMDIKPSNMHLGGDGLLRLIDFGLAAVISHGKESTSRRTPGTPAFTAPESASGDEFDPFKADVWSVGVTAYLMSAREYPFQPGQTLLDTYRRIQFQRVRIPSSVDPDVTDFIRQLLHRDPCKRASAAQALRHPFLHRVEKTTPN